MFGPFEYQTCPVLLVQYSDGYFTFFQETFTTEDEDSNMSARSPVKKSTAASASTTTTASATTNGACKFYNRLPYTSYINL